MVPEFSYEKKKIKFTKGYIFKGKHFRCSVVKYPSFYKKAVEGTETVDIYHFSPKEHPVGSIIILHGLGTTNIPFLFWMGSHLAGAGLQASVMILPGNYTRTANNSTSGKDFFTPDIERLSLFWEQAVVDTRTTIDLLEQEGIWLENNCLFGYCLGGMISIIANALEDRIARTILMTVGGDISRIMWGSPVLKYTRRGFARGEGKNAFLNDREKLLGTFEKDMEKVRGFKDVEELITSDVHPLLKVDPMAYAPFVHTDKFTMIEALFDRALPKKSRRILWETLGKPKRHIVPMGHVSWFPFEYALGRFILNRMGIREAVRKRRLLEKTRIELPVDDSEQIGK